MSAGAGRGWSFTSWSTQAGSSAIVMMSLPPSRNPRIAKVGINNAKA